jgi:hypothetical protein
VRVRIQGGPWVEGEAIGRRGSQALIRYRTVGSGAKRERWFTGDRFELPEGSAFEQLPRYRRVVCPGVDFDEPTTAGNMRYRDCTTCGERHEVRCERIDDQWMAVGLRSRNLGDERIDP